MVTINRRHIIKCTETYSEEVPVKYGVPQGSVLGPLCYILYVNDLITNVMNKTNAKIIMYADDTVLLVEDNVASVATEHMQRVLDSVSVWCQANKLTVNTKKTKQMLVLRSNDYDNDVEALQVRINDNALSNVTTYRYLGIDRDRNLTYRNAVHNTYLKANKKLFTLRKMNYVVAYLNKVNVQRNKF